MTKVKHQRKVVLCKYVLLFYFFLHCEEHPEFDSEFDTSMSHDLQGSSDDTNGLKTPTSSTKGGNSSVVKMLESNLALFKSTTTNLAEHQDKKLEILQLTLNEEEKKRKIQAKQVLLQPGVCSPDTREKVKASLLRDAGLSP